jgi:hypothetical protein
MNAAVDRAPGNPRLGLARSHAGMWLLIAVALTAPVLLVGQALDVRLVGEDVRVAAPSLHFIEGPVLERLKSGAPVSLDLLLSVASDNRSNVFKKITEKVILSYDLWEEKYFVASPVRKANVYSHRSSANAEAWCIEQLSVRSADLPSARSLWFRLEVKPEDLEDDPAAASRMSLRGMVDTFGRARGHGPLRFILEAGPLKLEDLRRPARKLSARLVAWKQ